MPRLRRTALRSDANGASPTLAPTRVANRSAAKVDGPVFRSAVDEVSIFFSATDHGRSVTDLTPEEVVVRDDSQLRKKSMRSAIKRNCRCDWD